MQNHKKVKESFASPLNDDVIIKTCIQVHIKNVNINWYYKLTNINESNTLVVPDYDILYTKFIHKYLILVVNMFRYAILIQISLIVMQTMLAQI